jgi:endonuclease YncB( thermonuclease family)
VRDGSSSSAIQAPRPNMILLASVLCASLIFIDGDTFVCNDEKIRILGLDAPETRSARCDAEYRLGMLAKRRLAELVGGANLEIRRDGKDRFNAHLRRSSLMAPTSPSR